MTHLVLESETADPPFILRPSIALDPPSVPSYRLQSLHFGRSARPDAPRRCLDGGVRRRSSAIRVGLRRPVGMTVRDLLGLQRTLLACRTSLVPERTVRPHRAFALRCAWWWIRGRTNRVSSDVSAASSRIFPACGVSTCQTLPTV